MRIERHTTLPDGTLFTCSAQPASGVVVVEWTPVETLNGIPQTVDMGRRSSECTPWEAVELASETLYAASVEHEALNVKVGELLISAALVAMEAPISMPRGHGLT